MLMRRVKPLPGEYFLQIVYITRTFIVYYSAYVSQFVPICL